MYGGLESEDRSSSWHKKGMIWLQVQNHAAAALANLTQRSLYGELWPHALKTVSSALAELQDSAWQDQHDSSPASAKLGMSQAAAYTACMSCCFTTVIVQTPDFNVVYHCTVPSLCWCQCCGHNTESGFLERVKHNLLCCTQVAIISSRTL